MPFVTGTGKGGTRVCPNQDVKRISILIPVLVMDHISLCKAESVLYEFNSADDRPPA
jgi:hypothetical protein